MVASLHQKCSSCHSKLDTTEILRSSKHSIGSWVTTATWFRQGRWCRKPHRIKLFLMVGTNGLCGATHGGHLV